MKYTRFPTDNFDVAPQIHIPTGNGHEQIRVVQLVMRETNTYQDQRYRPYQTQITADAMYGFQNTFSDSYTVTPSTLAQFANSILAPASQDRGIVPIVEGWSGRRFIFLMEIEVNRFAGTAETVILSGYTDYDGVSRQGHLDPNMRLYFNNAVKLQRVVDNMGTGLQTANRIMDVSQVLYDNPFVKPNFQSNAGGIVTMRPMDIYGRMQANHFQGEVQDWRNGVVNVDPVKFSKATNSIATNYISKIVSNLKTAVAAQDSIAGDWTNVLAHAQGYVPENKCRMDFVFKAFLNATDFNIGKSVTIRDLTDLSPSVTSDAVCKVIFNNTNNTDVFSANNTQHWVGSNYETIFASTLAHSVPALMMECMLRSVSFIAHNNTMDCQWVINFKDIPQSFSPGLNLNQYLSVWQQRLITEVLNSLMPGYYVPCSLEIDCDIVRDTVMLISYNDGAVVPFLNPSFANTLTSPVLTNNQEDLMSITNDMEDLCTGAGLNDDQTRGNHHGFNPIV
jgi:hypothetical protein